jgi:hypothetical protein
MPSPFIILVVIALLLAIGSFFRPAWPLLSVSVVLLAVAVLIGAKA